MLLLEPVLKHWHYHIDGAEAESIDLSGFWRSHCKKYRQSKLQVSYHLSFLTIVDDPMSASRATQ